MKSSRVRILTAALLATFTAVSVQAKSYDIAFRKETTAGAVPLRPGEYRLQIKGDTATITSVRSGKAVEVPVKVTTGDTKYKATAVQTNPSVTPEKLVYIELEGSKVRVEFAN